MASNSVHDICRTVAERGFWTCDDQSIGSRVNRIVESGLRLKTVDGLELCEASTFTNQNVRDVIDASFKEPVLRFFKVYGPTELDYCIENRSPKRDIISILVVILCSSGSEIIMHETSHLHCLDAIDASNGLLKISKDKLEQLGIIPKSVRLEHGGIILLDGRLGWKVLKGMTVLLGEMDHHHAISCARMPARMPWPSLPDLKAKVAEMDKKSKSFSRNFEWQSTS